MALGDLVSFVRVMEAGSVSAASRQLGIPRPTLSRRISRLEEHYGVRLVHRSTRSLTLTDAGMQVFQQGQAIVADLDALDSSVRNQDGAIRGVVRVSGPMHGPPEADMLYASFLKAHPEVQLEIVATSRRVDLVAERVDVAIRGGAVGNEDLIGKRVRDSRARLLASADYLDRRGTPKTVDELSAHDLLLGFAGTERVQRHWPRLDGGKIQVKGRTSCNGLATMLYLIREGLGIGLVPEFAMYPELAAGSVVRVLEDVIGDNGGLYVLYVERRYQQPQVRAFVDYAIERLGVEIVPPICPDRN